jgi:hypothetical protein
MAKEPHNPHLRRVLLEIVETQLRDGTPPETRTTLDRLLAEGHSRKKAIELIACVVSTEIFDVLKSGRPYVPDRFIAGLNALPRLPWEDDEE